VRFWGPTRVDIEENILKVTACVTSVLIGAGVVLCLTLFYVSEGAHLLLLGGGVGATGWLLSRVGPALGSYHEIRCSSCMTEHQVAGWVGRFSCSHCGENLFGYGFWRNGARKLDFSMKEQWVQVAKEHRDLAKSLRRRKENVQ